MAEPTTTPKLLTVACALALALGGCVAVEEEGRGTKIHPAQLLAQQTLRDDEARSQRFVEERSGAGRSAKPARRADRPRARADVAPAETRWVDELEAPSVAVRHPELRSAVDTRSLDLLSPEKRLLRARQALRDDQPRIAIEALHGYLAAAPDDEAARVDLARAYLLDGRDELAHDVLVSLLGGDAEQHEVLTLLGHVYARSGAHGRAAKLYEEAIETGGDRALLQPLLDRVLEP